MKEGRKHYCPQCGQQVALENEYFPFCSARCKLIDLGDWLDVRYRLATVRTEPPADEEGES